MGSKLCWRGRSSKKNMSRLWWREGVLMGFSNSLTSSEKLSRMSLVLNGSSVVSTSW